MSENASTQNDEQQNDSGLDLGWNHRWIASQNSETAPTLLLLHGTGGNEDDMVSLGKALSASANILSPRGRVLENGMPRFFRRHSIGVFDEDDLKIQTQALSSFVADAASCYRFDASRVIAVGFSNGANIAASLLLLSPQTLSGAVLLRAQVPLQPDEKSDLSRVRVLLASGEYDPIIPVESARALATMLRERGAHVTHEWQDAGHNLSSDDIEAASEWLQKHSADDLTADEHR